MKEIIEKLIDKINWYKKRKRQEKNLVYKLIGV